MRGADAFVIQSHPAPVNEWLMEQLIMIDALKRASAKRITVVSPFYPYGRPGQEARRTRTHLGQAGRRPVQDGGREPADGVDLHAAQIQGFFDGPVDHLFALPVLSDYVAAKYAAAEMTVVSPDAGRVQAWPTYGPTGWALPLAIIHKRRDPNKANEVAVGEVVGDVRGRVCLLVDDMIDTAGTICQAAAALREHGARRVIAAATHPILSGPAAQRLNASAFEEVIVTNTLPIREDLVIPKLTVLSIAPLIAKADPGGLRGRLGHVAVRRRVAAGPSLVERRRWLSLSRLASVTISINAQSAGASTDWRAPFTCRAYRTSSIRCEPPQSPDDFTRTRRAR